MLIHDEGKVLFGQVGACPGGNGGGGGEVAWVEEVGRWRRGAGDGEGRRGGETPEERQVDRSTCM